MKILKSFILSILIIFFCPLVVHAEFLPPTLPDTSLLPSFLQSVGQMQIVNDSNMYTSAPDLDRTNQIVNGRSIFDSINMNYVDNANLGQLQVFYDSEGNIIPQSDTYTVFGSSDVSNFSFVASKHTGEILLTLEDADLISTLCAGEFGFSELFPTSNNINQANLLQAIADSKSDYMMVYSQDISEADLSTLCNYDFHMTYTSTVYGYTVYVPNTASYNTVVTARGTRTDNFYYNGLIEVGTGDTATTYSISIFTNDPSEVFYSQTGQYNYLIRENRPVYGYDFSYVSYANTGFKPFYYGGFLDMRLPTEQEYNSIRAASQQVAYYQPIINEGETNNIYNYTYVTENPVKPSPVVNNNYNNQYDTNYYNYPVTNNISYPDYSSSTTNYYETIYNYYTTPNSNVSIGTLNPSDLTDNIPILSNLKYRFPFSIPWDLKALFSGLNVAREAPNFHWELEIPVISYTWVVDFDFSMWDSQANIFRTCFLILFIIGLATFAYKHYFGS